MKYMLLTYLDEKAWLAMSQAAQQHEIGKCEPHVKALAGKGKFLDGAPLHPTSRWRGSSTWAFSARG